MHAHLEFGIQGHLDSEVNAWGSGVIRQATPRLARRLSRTSANRLSGALAFTKYNILLGASIHYVVYPQRMDDRGTTASARADAATLAQF
jgi:hypothetical protein